MPQAVDMGGGTFSRDTSCLGSLVIWEVAPRCLHWTSPRGSCPYPVTSTKVPGLSRKSLTYTLLGIGPAMCPLLCKNPGGVGAVGPTELF